MEHTKKQTKHTHFHFTKYFHHLSKWGKFFVCLGILDGLFLLAILHTVLIFPPTNIGVEVVIFVLKWGLYVLYVLSLIHLFALVIYVTLERPRGWHLAASLAMLVLSVGLLYKYNFPEIAKGLIEQRTIPNMATISKQTAIRLLNECRINDVSITQLYGAKVTFYTLAPEKKLIKTVYLKEDEIKEVYNAVVAKGDDCGKPIKVYNDGTMNVN